MRNLSLSLLLAATAFTGTALAQSTTPTTTPSVTRPAPPHGGSMMMDASRDGVITRAEVLARADARFTAEDADRDGKVTPDERRAARDRMRAAAGKPERVPPPGGERGNGPGKRSDPNGDGVVTRAQMQASAAARFDRMDTSKDGRIDVTERAVMRQMRHGHRGHHRMPGQPAASPQAVPPAQ